MKVAYLTNVVPAYRTDFVRRLFADERLDITVFCHASVHGHSVELVPEEYRHRLVRCPTVRLPGGGAIFEKLPFRAILSGYDVIISDGNPRHAGFALLSTTAALIRRRVIIWSTLHSRRNRAWTQSLRLGWWRIFPEFLSYTEPDAVALRAHYPRRIARSTNNGLNQEAMDRAKLNHSPAALGDFKAGLGLAGKRIGVSLGRAIPGRFDLMAAVLSDLESRAPDFHWILLGDGDGMAGLKAQLAKHRVTDRATLAGAVHDEDELAKWFGIADLFVYPDAIGLSLYHAFGYGLPVIAHDEIALHGPEMAAFEDGKTGLTFRNGDARHMAERIEKLLADDRQRREMGRYALEIVRNRYNAQIMYERFVHALLEPDARF